MMLSTLDLFIGEYKGSYFSRGKFAPLSFSLDQRADAKFRPSPHNKTHGESRITFFAGGK